MTKGDDKVLIVNLRLSVGASIVKHLTDLYKLYQGPASVMSGCEGIDLYTHFANPHEFILIEEWSSPHALEHHIKSDDFRKVLAMMDLSDTPPDLKIRSIQWEKGFEMVEKLREEKA
jgi:quinol monooxygenase YgiN